MQGKNGQEKNEQYEVMKDVTCNHNLGFEVMIVYNRAHI